MAIIFLQIAIFAVFHIGAAEKEAGLVCRHGHGHSWLVFLREWFSCNTVNFQSPPLSC